MTGKVQKLLKLAKKIMSESSDPIHDLAHVKRVASYCDTIAKSYDLTDKQLQALTLAAWWHDASRTITAEPSVMIMPFIDDTLSALMLWRETIRFKLFGSVAGMATRIIFCKSKGTGALLTKLFLRKKNHILLEILKDADAIDLVHVDRANYIKEMVDSSFVYKVGYKVMVHWFMAMNTVQVKTIAGKKLLLQLLDKLLEWIKQQEIYLWNVELLSKKVTTKLVLYIQKNILILSNQLA